MRGVLIEYADIVDGFQARQHGDPFLNGENRAAPALDAADGVVAVEAQEERVAQGAGPLQKSDVARMDQIEAAIRENQPGAGSCQTPPDPAGLGQAKDLSACGIGIEWWGQGVRLVKSRAVTNADGRGP